MQVSSGHAQALGKTCQVSVDSMSSCHKQHIPGGQILFTLTALLGICEALKPELLK